MSLCATKMQDQPEILSSVMEMLASIMRDPVRAIALDIAALHPEQPGDEQENIADFEEMPLESLIPALVSLAAKQGEPGNGEMSTISAKREANPTNSIANLPKQIVSSSPSPSSSFFRSGIDPLTDIPLLSPFFVRRTVLAHRSFQTEGHLALHCGQSELERSPVDELPLRPPLRNAVQIHARSGDVPPEGWRNGGRVRISIQATRRS